MLALSREDLVLPKLDAMRQFLNTRMQATAFG
jgi:hypothetical protein